MRAIHRATLAIAALAIVAPAARAQNEAALRAAFEGKSVVARIDLPATSQGVDVHPGEQMPVDFRAVAQRLKDNGTAIRMGQRVMVTKVLVKKNSHIEFQLGGGGYGTFMDWATNGTDVQTAAEGESNEERALRAQIRATSDKDARKKLERELDGMRATRQRENARAAAEAQQANLARETSIRSKRAESGSRFNVRFRAGIPAEALTPEGLTRALAQYLEFPDAPAATSLAGAGAADAPTVVAVANTRGFAPTAGPAAARPASAAAAPAAGLSALRKGLGVQEVEALLGPAATAAEAREGQMTVMKRTYRHDGMRVSARFVAGVLIDFAITPE